ncbi:spore coat associated protein CotJA [Bacillus sp. 165]|uniref:spore coat associated protein CotJA n=1 Tax=Bacillus sp. 165 TaxID=1529117 RepID=UPI0032AFC5A6
MQSYTPYHSPQDPCPSIGQKYYFTPPQLYVGFQPENLEQFNYKEALKKGTLWPIFYDSYENPYKGRR